MASACKGRKSEKIALYNKSIEEEYDIYPIIFS